MTTPMNAATQMTGQSNQYRMSNRLFN
jgi:hypothetical protein